MPAMVRVSTAGPPRDAESSSSDQDESAAGNLEEDRVLNFLAPSEDPRTLSQIKRSRIDLARRYVFLCPMSLSKYFDALPHQAKDSALLVFRCSRNRLFLEPQAVRVARTQSKIDTGTHRSPAHGATIGASPSKAPVTPTTLRSEYSREFLQWVLTKEKEGCVFWYKPERDLEKMSKFFEDKIDPVNDQPYRPLLLDPQWWRVRFQRTAARFIGNPRLVVSAIAGRSAEPHADSGSQDIDIPTLQELIYQSNPSLEPISKWPHAPSMRFLPRELASRRDYVGQETKYRGYIDSGDGARSPAEFGAAQSRISKWPEPARDRFDNLHVLWQTEEASQVRRQCFALHGLSTVNSGSVTAR